MATEDDGLPPPEGFLGDHQMTRRDLVPGPGQAGGNRQFVLVFADGGDPEAAAVAVKPADRQLFGKGGQVFRGRRIYLETVHWLQYRAATRAAHRLIELYERTRGGSRITCLRSQQLASYYAKDFTDLWSHGKIVDSTGYRDTGIVRLNNVAVTIGFTPGESPAVLKEIVGAIAAARNRLYVASGVLSSGPILAALSETIDRGLPLGSLYDGPQMDQVERQWKAANVGTDKLNTWQKVARHLVRKNSIPFDRQNQSQ